MESMRLVALLGTAAFVGVGALVGARVLRMAWRTRQLPETCIGGSLFLFAAVGQPLVVTSRALGAAFGYEARAAAVALALAAIVASIVGLCVFTRLVFRPDSRLAATGVVALGLLAASSGVVVVISIPEVPGSVTAGMRLGISALSLVFCAGMAWTAAEALRYHARLRRRLAIGLADPVVVNRFLLWGSGCAIACLSSLGMIACVSAGMDVAVHPATLLMTAASGLVIAVCWYLTFLPPARYQRWLAGAIAS